MSVAFRRLAVASGLSFRATLYLPVETRDWEETLRCSVDAGNALLESDSFMCVDFLPPTRLVYD